MFSSAQIAKEIAQIMPVIARTILSDFFQSVDITQSQVFTLLALEEQSPCRLSELSQRLKISAPTVTGLVDRLEKLQYLKRIPDPTDRRAIQVDLTDKGNKVIKKLRLTIERKWIGILQKLSTQDSENYLKILRKIYEAI